MERVDVLLVCEVDDAVESVVLDELERGIHMVWAVVNGGRRSVELVAAPDVAVDDGGAAQGGGSLRRGFACLDNDPEQRWLDEAQRLAHPGEVEGMRSAGARGRDDDEQLVWVRGEVRSASSSRRQREQVCELPSVGQRCGVSESRAANETNRGADVRRSKLNRR
jgi:hypothetical protein